MNKPPYHLYLGCKVMHPIDRAEFTFVGIDRNKKPLLFGDWSGGTNPEYSSISFCEWKDLTFVLRSLTDLKLEEFADICRVLWNIPEESKLLFDKVSGYYAVTTDEDDYKEEDESMSIHDRIVYAEEADYENVLSFCPKSHSLAYGTSDEMRYFVGTRIDAKFTVELIKRGFDLKLIPKEQVLIKSEQNV
jgi:hypothetical protein